jgi:glycosyltransferase involved in cell wall biosynthesis
MRILHTVEFYHPSVGGAQEVVKQISERLAAFGHEVTVATSEWPGRQSLDENGVHIRPFAIQGSYLRGIQGDQESYRRFVREGGFDVVMNYAAQQWATDALLEHLGSISAAKVLVPCGFSGLLTKDWAPYFERLKTQIRGYDSCVLLAEDYRDVRYCKEAGARRLELIPNGADEREFAQPSQQDIRAELGIPPQAFLVLTVGSHTGLKGHREAMAMLRESRIPGACLLVVGNGSPGGCARGCQWRATLHRLHPSNWGSQSRVLVRALTRAQTVAAYHAADGFLFPSNIECSPIVLFEAMASRTPFIATDVGNAAEIARWGGSGWIIQTQKGSWGESHASIADGARLLRRLWEDPQARLQMAEQGRKAWEARYTWDALARRYEALYLSLLEQKGRS